MTPRTQIAATLLLAIVASIVWTGPDTLIAAGRGAADTAAVAAPAPGPPHVRAYVFRGLLGPVFSRGMDRLNERLELAAIPTDVHSFTTCAAVAHEAIEQYRADPAPIALIGHSAGALCTLTFADILKESNIPASLVVSIDPPRIAPRVPLNVERFINLYLSNGMLGGGDVLPSQGYQGHYASFDLSNQGGVNHVTIDKLDVVHEQIVAKVRELATTATATQGDSVALRYAVPADATIELWDSGMPVFARQGETLQSLSASLGVPLWSLIQSNKALESKPLAEGERVIVPRHLMPLATAVTQSPPKR